MALLDPGDEAVVFRPYYFNHVMALQLVNTEIKYASCKEDLTPGI